MNYLILGLFFAKSFLIGILKVIGAILGTVIISVILCLLATLVGYLVSLPMALFVFWGEWSLHFILSTYFDLSILGMIIIALSTYPAIIIISIKRHAQKCYRDAKAEVQRYSDRKNS